MSDCAIKILKLFLFGHIWLESRNPIFFSTVQLRKDGRIHTHKHTYTPTHTHTHIHTHTHKTANQSAWLLKKVQRETMQQKAASSCKIEDCNSETKCWIEKKIHLIQILDCNLQSEKDCVSKRYVEVSNLHNLSF